MLHTCHPRNHLAAAAALLAAAFFTSGVEANVVSVTGAGSHETFSDMAAAMDWVSDPIRSMNQYDVHVSGSNNTFSSFNLAPNASMGWGDSPGVLEILGVRQVPISLGGAMQFEVGGTINSGAFGVPRGPVQYDTILVLDAQSVNCSGVVSITLINGFTPTLGQTFEILATNSTINWTGLVSGPALAGNLIWTASVQPGSFSGGQSLFVTVAQGYAVPAPAAAALVGCVGLFARRRRHG